jgi:hypothetical protein
MSSYASPAYATSAAAAVSARVAASSLWVGELGRVAVLGRHGGTQRRQIRRRAHGTQVAKEGAHNRAEVLSRCGVGCVDQSNFSEPRAWARHAARVHRQHAGQRLADRAWPRTGACVHASAVGILALVLSDDETGREMRNLSLLSVLLTGGERLQILDAVRDQFTAGP